MDFSLILIMIAVIIIIDWFRKKRVDRISLGMPGEMAVPIIGTWMLFEMTDIESGIQCLSKCYRKFNGVARLWIFNKFNVILTRPEELRIILSSQKYATKSNIYDPLKPWLNEGLLTSSPSKSHARRKIITPAFHFKILEEFVQIFDQQSRVLVKQMEVHTRDEAAFNVFPYISKSSLDMVCEAAMGVKINSQSKEDNIYERAVNDLSEICMHRITRQYLTNDLIFNIFAPKMKKHFNKSVKELHSFTEGVIEKRRQEVQKQMSKGEMDDEEYDETGTKKKMALLDILLQSTVNGQPLTNADIREEVDTFTLGAHDTTSSAVSFALHLISRHPDVQQKMFDEIHQVIGDDRERSVSMSDLQDLKYCEMVIKETLRMFPSIPVIGRKFAEDMEISGYIIPKGAQLYIPIFLIHRDEKYFPDPDTFNPERFAGDKITEKAFTYIPFSAGPRNCVGQKYAMLSMKMTLSNILRSYELLPLGEAVAPVINLTYQSSNGMQIGIKPRVYY